MCCRYYHASLDAAEREDVQRRWSNDEIQVGAQRQQTAEPTPARAGLRVRLCMGTRGLPLIPEIPMHP